MSKTAINSAYLEALSLQTGAERVVRSGTLLAFTAEALAYRIRTEDPTLSERQIHLAVAKRIYMGEEEVLALLEEIS